MTDRVKLQLPSKFQKDSVAGRVKSTRLRAPFKLIHYEYFVNMSDAKAREKFLKSGFGRKQLKESLKRTLFF